MPKQQSSRIGANGWGTTRPILTLQERLDLHTDYSGDCWIWTGSRDSDGYGRIKINGKMRRASHISYEVSTGLKVPDGKQLCHTCDNPPCIRPTHLFPGTVKDNADDRDKKGRHKAASGEQHYATKLTVEIVADIRLRIANGPYGTKAAIAREYGIGAACITKIVQGTNWKI